jgi:hypothetical protein
MEITSTDLLASLAAECRKLVDASGLEDGQGGGWESYDCQLTEFRKRLKEAESHLANRENDMSDNDKAKTPDVLEGVMATTPTITFPPLKDSDGNPEPVLSVTFAVGPYSLEIVTEGAGAYLAVEIEGEVELNPDELTALAAWVESVCKAMDKHNGEGHAKR